MLGHDIAVYGLGLQAGTLCLCGAVSGTGSDGMKGREVREVDGIRHFAAPSALNFSSVQFSSIQKEATGPVLLWSWGHEGFLI